MQSYCYGGRVESKILEDWNCVEVNLKNLKTTSILPLEEVIRDNAILHWGKQWLFSHDGKVRKMRILN